MLVNLYLSIDYVINNNHIYTSYIWKMNFFQLHKSKVPWCVCTLLKHAPNTNKKSFEVIKFGFIILSS